MMNLACDLIYLVRSIKLANVYPFCLLSLLKVSISCVKPIKVKGWEKLMSIQRKTNS